MAFVECSRFLRPDFPHKEIFVREKDLTSVFFKWTINLTWKGFFNSFRVKSEIPGRNQQKSASWANWKHCKQIRLRRRYRRPKASIKEKMWTSQICYPLKSGVVRFQEEKKQEKSSLMSFKCFLPLWCPCLSRDTSSISQTTNKKTEAKKRNQALMSNLCSWAPTDWRPFVIDLGSIVGRLNWLKNVK